MIKNPEKLNELITECAIRRYTTEESLDYIKKNGIKLSQRTFRRYKKELNDRVRDRILEVDDNVLDDQRLQGLAVMKKVDKEFWNLFYSTKNELLKTKLLESIQNLQDRLIDYHHKVKWRAFHIKNEIKEKEEEERRLENSRLAEKEEEAMLEKSKSRKNVVCN